MHYLSLLRGVWTWPKHRLQKFGSESSKNAHSHSRYRNHWFSAITAMHKCGDVVTNRTTMVTNRSAYGRRAAACTGADRRQQRRPPTEPAAASVWPPWCWSWRTPFAVSAVGPGQIVFPVASATYTGQMNVEYENTICDHMDHKIMPTCLMYQLPDTSNL